MNISPKQRQQKEQAEYESRGTLSFITDHDWRYGAWKAGVVITDRTFLYLLMYTLMSVLG